MDSKESQKSGPTHIQDLAVKLEHMSVENLERRMSVDIDDQLTEEVEQYITSDNSTHSFQDIKSQPEGRETKGGNILIVTNVDPLVFSDQFLKSKFESLFLQYDANVAFRYLKSFKRVRLDFLSESAAETARMNLNNYRLGDTTFRCYLARMIKLQSNDSLEQDDNERLDPSNSQQTGYLNIPKPTKQFLISPPASPPVGWEPVTEGSPCIDVQLISAIANLVPGQVHEIHAGSESQPGIYVEVCEEPHFDRSQNMRKIPKTPSPCFNYKQ